VSEEQAALLLACRRHPLAAEVARGLARARVGDGCRVAVAASGGADSTALLALCAGLRAHGRIDPVAVHVDHGLRDESGLDRACAASAAERLGVAFASRRLDLRAGSGVAARAREARFAALAEMAVEQGASVVLLAHHADDQLETLLLAIARGAGLAGLGGMPSRRAIDGTGIDAVRPCLRIRRVALREACATLGLEWREDPGNDRRDTPRGVMRHVVLPALEGIAPGVPGRAARSAELARLGAVLLESHVEAMRGPGGEIPRAALRGAPEALAASAVRFLAGDRIDDASVWQAAEAACDAVTDPRRFPLEGGGELVIDAHAIRER
jgi:tRNA(Ile)-lysidine synthase